MAYSPPSQRPRSMRRQRALQKGKSGHSARVLPCRERWQMGQRGLFIGCSGLGFRGLFGRLIIAGCVCTAVRTGGSGFVRGSRLGRFLLGLRGSLVRLTTIIGLVKAGTLEKDGGPRAEDAPQFRLAALRAFLQGLVFDGLKFVKMVLASIAMVFVGWHTRLSSAS